MYAILSTKKHKSFAAVSRYAQHTFREQPTPNANPDIQARKEDAPVGSWRLIYKHIQRIAPLLVSSQSDRSLW